MSNIEVEARAILSPDQREEMLAYMSKLGKIQEVARVMIDFSGENRRRTVALRINDGRQQLIAKTGGLSSMVRREAKVAVDPENSLTETLGYLEVMGYKEGMLSLRKMYTVQTESLEYSVRDVLRPGSLERAATLLDVEALGVTEGDEEAAQQNVQAAFAGQGLTPLTATEWEQWVKDTYEHVDQPFVNAPENAEALSASLVDFQG